MCEFTFVLCNDVFLDAASSRKSDIGILLPTNHETVQEGIEGKFSTEVTER